MAEGDSFQKARAEVHLRRAWLYPAQWAVLSALVAIPALVDPGPYMLWWVVWYAAIVAAGFALEVLRRRWPRVHQTDVRADRSGLHLSRQLLVKRDAIRAAHVHRAGRVFVRLVEGHRPIDVFVDGAAEADRLIAALGLAPPQTIVRHRVSDGTARQVRIRAAAIVAVAATLCLPLFCVLVFVGVGAAAAGAAILLAVYTIVILRLNLTLFVGADGLRVQRLLSASRFFHYADMASITRDGPNLTLRLRDGRTLTISAGATGAFTRALLGTDIEYEIDGLVRHVAARIDAQGTEGAPHIREALARGERQTQDWLEALRGYSNDRTTFRTLAPPPDAFWAVVEDSTAPATARLGAAVALHPELDDDGRLRLRLAAAACAEPRLRLALERAARGLDDAALADTMDALDDEIELRRST